MGYFFLSCSVLLCLTILFLVRHDDNKPSTTNQTTSPPKEIKGSDSMAESKIADIKSEEEKTWLEASKAWPELSQGHSTKVGTLLTAMNNANKVLPEHPREQPEKVETLLAALQMERDLPAVDQGTIRTLLYPNLGIESLTPQRKKQISPILSLNLQGLNEKRRKSLSLLH
jgi:hypothetical protein